MVDDVEGGQKSLLRIPTDSLITSAAAEACRGRNQTNASEGFEAK
jgi:hypothetical protein